MSCLYPTKLEQLQHMTIGYGHKMSCLYPTKLEQLQLYAVVISKLSELFIPYKIRAATTSARVRGWSR